MSSYRADLELARRCAAGEPAAWDRFVREYRPVLYRAADSLDPNGGAREIADSLYAELYGVNNTGRSLLLSFSGRSSLATWLRAVLCQRFVDRLREATELPVESFDERFTTALAHRTGETRAAEDAVAAAHLLTSYLQWKASARPA